MIGRALCWLGLHRWVVMWDAPLGDFTGGRVPVCCDRPGCLATDDL